MVAQQQEILTSVMKGKRTKRPRAASLSPAPLADEGGPQNSSDASSVEWAGTGTGTGPHNTEEEDMAHCLILLAQGSKPLNDSNKNNMNHEEEDNNTTTTMTTTTTTTTTYECKTCNKSFPSFQALGGHRASHKKPKLSIALPDNHAKKSSVFFSLLQDHHPHHHDDGGQFNDQEIALSLQLANGGATSSTIHNSSKAAKVHECSICGAEFSSGQALGGHMRRHRPIGGTTPTSIPSPTLNLSSIGRDQEKTRNNILSLDLNLPAPEDDHQHRDHSKFVFPSNEKTLVFSASSLVDCHY